ncbi:hypothetical protein C4D60_Mb06t34980 [Musa balbisiana]|uniref:Uncharacterized protein n=1 Tax=Musa balbisiana TaxID=52838 RepID=A0A4S8IVD8_MUSBA|nr:hypothetical protein C4D60_Mb06t34980 [Musa balbisiana]
MVLPQPNTGIFVGLNKGHIVTNREFSPLDLPEEKIRNMNERMPQRDKADKAIYLTCKGAKIHRQ